MKTRLVQLFLAAGLVGGSANAEMRIIGLTTNTLGFTTNGSMVWETRRIIQLMANPAPTNLPPRALTNAMFQRRFFTNEYVYTNHAFNSFLPGSLSHHIWTNHVATTNGRDMQIWSERTHPLDWPTNAPTAVWNTNSVIWGLKGITALSPCWEGEGAPGQVPFTLLTRRHAYTRGHHMGDDGFGNKRTGMKVWFFTKNNRRIEAIIKQNVVRCTPGANKEMRDYTIVLFDRDLPDTIESMSVTAAKTVQQLYLTPTLGAAPLPIFQTEQGGFVSTGIAPLTVNTWKGGDSGSPNMVPLPGELVFFSGRSTSGPSREMQEDMDELCRREKLNPAKYQLQWVDLGGLPAK